MMKRRLLTVILCLALLLTPALTAGAEAGTLRSGSLDLPKLSQAEIAQLLQNNPLGFAGDALAQTPSVAAPYATGAVSDVALSTALNRFNALRRLAGLGAVSLDGELTGQAQYGAVLLAATGTLTHHPEKPDDMEQDFYEWGRYATSSSNIYQGTNATLPQAVEAFFDDSDAGNLPMLGHRRWMLNPTMGKTGLGFSPSAHAYGLLNYNFATLWAFDRSAQAPDYDFVAWPASGNFPSTLFAGYQAWSVTLNPEKYQVPALADLTVTLTRQSDGNTFTLSGDQTYSPSNTGAYLGLNTGNYGVPNAIIFRPDFGGRSYAGRYTVSVQGLRTADGQAAPFTYEVDFFDPNATPAGSSTPADEPVKASTFTDVAPGSWYAQAVTYAADRGLFNGVGGGRFAPDGTMTRAMVMTVLARLDGEDTTPRMVGETWDLRGRRWAVTNRISDGLNYEQAITLEELATMLYRYAQLRRDASPAHTYHLSTMPDGNSVSSWATDAANWAVDQGVLIGDEARNLNPQRTATRAQVAIVLQRFLEG